MLQQRLNLHEKKSAKRKRKRGTVLLKRNLSGETDERERPVSTGVTTGQKVWQADEGFLLRSRTATCNGSPSSFCNFTSRATCYNCLYDEANGREFCEIMGSSYCKQCIKTTRQKEIDEEVSCVLGISENGYKSLLGDNFFTSRQSPSLAFPSEKPPDKHLFIRLHNFNSNSAEYYINPTDGIGTTSASTQEISYESGRSLQLANQTTPNRLQIPGGDQETTPQRSLGKKKRKRGGTGKVKRKFVTFNGLPIEPPLITVDLSNQIMNHLVIKDS